MFNVLVGNRDDHLRNHGFLRSPGGWRLAPAFDVNPNPDRDEHALALDGASHLPSVAAIRATRELYRLSSEDAARIEQEVRRALEGWREVAARLRLRRSEVTRLGGIIDARLE